MRRIYILVDDNNYVKKWSVRPFFIKGEVAIDLDPNHEIFKDETATFKYVDGCIIKIEKNTRKIYFTIDDDFYLTGLNSTPSFVEGELSLEIDKNHEIFEKDASIFLYVDGELVKDKEKQQQLIEESERKRKEPSDIERLEIAVMELAIYTMNGVKE